MEFEKKKGSSLVALNYYCLASRTFWYIKILSNSDPLFVLKKTPNKTNTQAAEMELEHSSVPESFSSALLLYSKTMLDTSWSSQWIVYHNMTAQYGLIFFLAYSVRGLGQKGAGVTLDKHSSLTDVEITYSIEQSVPWTGLIRQRRDWGSRDVANTGGWNPVRGMLKNGEEIWMK